MKILVTGGAGFIGSKLVNRLLEEKHTVFVLDNLSTGSVDNFNNRAYNILGDCTNEVDLEEIFFNHRPDVVFHLSAQTSVDLSMENPVYDMENNYKATLLLLKYMKKYDSKKIIFTSSCAVYGDTNKLPVKESDRVFPISHYGINKLASELAIMNSGIDYAILRLGNVYGETANKGVIYEFVKASAEGKKLKVFGNGMNGRDYIYIDDVVDALINAMNLKQSIVANVSSNEMTTVLDIVEILKDIRGEVNLTFLPFKEGDIKAIFLDNTRAQVMLKWKPKISLEDGIRKVLLFHIQEKV